MTVSEKEETRLISQVLEGDSEALQKLVRVFEPLIQKTKRQYHLRDFDDSDWEQEALITCYNAVLTYKKEKGRFAVYFRSQFVNHIRTILRSYMADCRSVYLKTESLDALKEQGEQNLSCTKVMPMEYSINEIGNKFFNSLSDIELMAFHTLIGLTTDQEAIDKWNIELTQLSRARCRAYHKLMNNLF